MLEIDRLNRIKEFAYSIDQNLSKEALILAVLSDSAGRRSAARQLNIASNYFKDPIKDLEEWKKSRVNSWKDCNTEIKENKEEIKWPAYLCEKDSSLRYFDFDRDDDEKFSPEEDEELQDSDLEPDEDEDEIEGTLIDDFQDVDEKDQSVEEMFLEYQHLMGEFDEEEYEAKRMELKRKNQCICTDESDDDADDYDLDTKETDIYDSLVEHKEVAVPEPPESPDDILTVDCLVSRLIEHSYAVDWIRKHIAGNVKSLRTRLDFAAGKTLEKFPQYAEEIKGLKDLIFIQASQYFEATNSRPFPVFLFSNSECDIPSLLDTFSRILGCVLLMHDSTTDEDEFGEALKKNLPHLVLFSSCLERSSSLYGNRYIEKVLRYFIYGRFYKNNITNYKPALFESKIVRKIVLLHVEVPNEIYKFERYEPEELLCSIIDTMTSSAEESAGDRQSSNMFYKRVSALLKSQNSIIFKPLSIKTMFEKILDTMHSVNDELIANSIYKSRINLTNDRLLAVLIMLSNIDANLSNIFHNIKNVLHKVYSILEGNGKWEYSVKFQDTQIFEGMAKFIGSDKLYDLLEHRIKMLKISRSFLDSDIEIDHAGKEVIICNIRTRSRNNKVAGRYSIETPDTKFDDVIGFEEAKEKMLSFVDYLNNRKEFDKFGIKPDNRLLLCGAPGTGKTFLAKAFAGESRLPFFYLSASEITSQKYSGWGAILLRDLFAKAKNYKPCVIFIDELDALGSRDKFGEGSVGYDATSILNTFLVLLDGINTEYNILVIGATNKPESLDEALTRAKRFGTRINAGCLNYQERRKLVMKKLSSRLCGDDYERIVETIAVRTAGNISPVFIENIIEEAKRNAVLKRKKALLIDDISETIDNLLIGRKTCEISDEYKRSTAYHEAGHALLIKLLSSKTRITKVSIGQRDDTVGNTITEIDKKDNILEEYTRDDLITQIMCSLGGSIAERIVCGHWGTGSSFDIGNATLLAKNVVLLTDTGNGYNCAVEYFINPSENYVPQELIELTKRLLDKCSGQTELILRQHRELLDKLAKKLYEQEDLNRDDLEAILGNITADRDKIVRDIIKSLRPYRPVIKKRRHPA